MKLFAVAIALVGLVAATQCQAQGLTDYRSKTTGLKPSLSKSDVSKLWAMDKPACVKDGGSVKAANAAFVKAGLKTRDCSQGEKTLAKHAKLGIKVYVIACYQLPSDMVRIHCTK